jgi:hypothetical protein
MRHGAPDEDRLTGTTILNFRIINDEETLDSLVLTDSLDSLINLCHLLLASCGCGIVGSSTRSSSCGTSSSCS